VLRTSKPIPHAIRYAHSATAPATSKDWSITANTAHSMPNFPGLYRKNNVPAWQKLHQTHDGLRQWQKVG
jgi:hypothetical protein